MVAKTRPESTDDSLVTETRALQGFEAETA